MWILWGPGLTLDGIEYGDEPVWGYELKSAQLGMQHIRENMHTVSDIIQIIGYSH